MSLQIGDFQLLEKLGEGGMGEVWRARDLMLEREVALKLLKPDLALREDVLDRFRTEAIALARLNHPNIATLYSFSRHSDHYYMVMEYVRGEPLDRLLARRGRLPWTEALDIAMQGLSGLEHAHRLAVIHRDLKPANLMIGPSGEVKLMDFGIARILARARLTRVGHLVGTLEYMPPEQVQGMEADARSDIYAMGVVLYEMLSGQVPFTRETEFELLRAQVEELPPPLERLVPDLPEAVAMVVARALAKQPADRFDSADAFRAALQGAVNGSAAWPEGRKVAPETRLCAAVLHTGRSVASGPGALAGRPAPGLAGYMQRAAALLRGGMPAALLAGTVTVTAVVAGVLALTGGPPPRRITEPVQPAVIPPPPIPDTPQPPKSPPAPPPAADPPPGEATTPGDLQVEPASPPSPPAAARRQKQAKPKSEPQADPYWDGIRRQTDSFFDR